MEGPEKLHHYHLLFKDLKKFGEKQKLGMQAKSPISQYLQRLDKNKVAPRMQSFVLKN